MNNTTVLIIGLVWPEPQSSAAGKRMIDLIVLFKKWGYHIIFASTASESEYNFDLNEIDVVKQSIELNSSSFDVFVTEIRPEIVLFDRFITEEQFGWRVRKCLPNALKILDSEDLHCLRYSRAAALKSNEIFKIEHLNQHDWTKREIASILRCDLTLVIAEFERGILVDYFKIDPILVHYFPILFRDNELNFHSASNDFEARSDFIFIGNFWHEPNWDAVLYLKNTIWPLIRKQLPKSNLKVYGAYPSQKVFDLTNKKEGFLVLGRAVDSKKVLEDARVLIAPLRFGAGIKGKLLEGMLVGTPSITSSIGAESINGEMDWSGFITDSADEFASKAVLLYENRLTWEDAQANGFKILQQRFSLSQFESSLHEKVASLLSNLQSHRHSNFIGALLMHHSMRSTEYLSRWIEEKNKK